MLVLVAFVLGVVVCFVFTAWARGQWFTKTVGACCVQGCARESQHAAFVIEKRGFAIHRAWGLCRWHANDCVMKVRVEGELCELPRAS